jgi:AAA15 family ATPase/GTPase
MILNILLKNFRSFKEEISFSLVAESSKSKEQNVFLQPIAKGEDEVRLLNSAVIYGANSSGKSNLLRAVFEIVRFICKSKTNAGEVISAYDPFRFAEETHNAPIDFSIEFVLRDNIKYRYELSYDAHQILSEELTYWPNNKPVNLFTRDVPASESLIHIGRLGPSLKSREIEVFQTQALLSKFGHDIPDRIITEAFIYLNRLEVINACNSNKLAELKRNVTTLMSNNPSLLEKMNELLRFADTGLNGIKISEIDEKEFSFPEDIPLESKQAFINRYRFNIMGQHSFFNKKNLLHQEAGLSFDEESNGVKTLFSVGGRMLDALSKGETIFVDELETSLHPYLSKVLVSLFQNKRINKKNAQLIFTTHDTNLLDKTLFRKDQVWFAQKDEFGETDLYSLQDYSDVREDTPFDKWYLAGKFGGIPNIKSLENLFIDL